MSHEVIWALTGGKMCQWLCERLMMWKLMDEWIFDGNADRSIPTLRQTRSFTVAAVLTTSLLTTSLLGPWGISWNHCYNWCQVFFGVFQGGFAAQQRMLSPRCWLLKVRVLLVQLCLWHCLLQEASTVNLWPQVRAVPLISILNLWANCAKESCVSALAVDLQFWSQECTWISV